MIIIDVRSKWFFVRLHISIRVLESVLWNKNLGMQLISNPAKNGNEPKRRIDDESSRVLAYDLHRREIEILRQTPQIHQKIKNQQGMQVINDSYKAGMAVS